MGKDNGGLGVERMESTATDNTPSSLLPPFTLSHVIPHKRGSVQTKGKTKKIKVKTRLRLTDSVGSRHLTTSPSPRKRRSRSRPLAFKFASESSYVFGTTTDVHLAKKMLAFRLLKGRASLRRFGIPGASTSVTTQRIGNMATVTPASWNPHVALTAFDLACASRTSPSLSGRPWDNDSGMDIDTNEGSFQRAEKEPLNTKPHNISRLLQIGWLTLDEVRSSASQVEWENLRLFRKDCLRRALGMGRSGSVKNFRVADEFLGLVGGKSLEMRGVRWEDGEMPWKLEWYGMVPWKASSLAKYRNGDDEEGMADRTERWQTQPATNILRHVFNAPLESQDKARLSARERDFHVYGVVQDFKPSMAARTASLVEVSRVRGA
ncbi:hypothetical protein ONZ45_g16422 [Pleurotus djamor]|nr:hypothetical protein ONZ45_g16422 [Pleurotus djamor]